MTETQNQILTSRYPLEGASDSLCRDLGLQAWQVRHYAGRAGLKVNDTLKKRKQRRYTRGTYRDG